MPIIPFNGITPKIGENVFIAPTAWITGDVSIEDNVSIFFGVVIRGDINPIRIGAGSNIQENVVIHTSRGRGICSIGEDVTVGHNAILHGCRIEREVLIGMGATVLDDAVVESNSLVGAGSLVTEGKIITEGSLAFGRPAKVVRMLSEEERASITGTAKHYRSVGGEYVRELG